MTGFGTMKKDFKVVIYIAKWNSVGIIVISGYSQHARRSIIKNCNTLLQG